MGLVFPPLIDTVLAGVPLEDAGSASGVLNTAQQLGSAIGVAVIGVIFFGLLTSQAAPAQAVTQGCAAACRPPACPRTSSSRSWPASRHAPATAPPPRTPPRSRPAASRPSRSRRRPTPPACPAGHRSGRRRRPQRVFTRATQQTLWFNAGVFLAASLLSLLLPATPAAASPNPTSKPTTVTA